MSASPSSRRSGPGELRGGSRSPSWSRSSPTSSRGPRRTTSRRLRSAWAPTCSSQTRVSRGLRSSSTECSRPSRSEGGAPLAVCLHRARAADLGGIEFVCAIPGTVGGGVWMNAGAYGNDIATVLVQAHVVDGRSARWLTPDELGLRYRRSDLVRGQVVAGAEFGLQPKPEAEIKESVREMQQKRKDAQPTNKRTFGSVFKNPDHELTAGRMLEACGLKGHRIGGAQISPKHANFIENAGGASSADALALIAEARRRALEQFGVRLEAEVQLLGPIEIPPLHG